MPGWKRPSDVFVLLSFRCQSNQSQAPSQESQQRERERESGSLKKSASHTHKLRAKTNTNTHTPICFDNVWCPSTSTYKRTHKSPRKSLDDVRSVGGALSGADGWWLTQLSR